MKKNYLDVYFNYDNEEYTINAKGRELRDALYKFLPIFKKINDDFFSVAVVCYACEYNTINMNSCIETIKQDLQLIDYEEFSDVELREFFNSMNKILKRERIA